MTNAWVTLLTRPNYVPGVRTLRASLEKSGSGHPLVVMITGDIDDDTRRLLEGDGCLVRRVDPLGPRSTATDAYANARFAEVWTKLAAWNLVEFDRVVFLDADMLVLQNMDELFTRPLGPGTIAACHACRCNPNRIASYPPSWTPERCHYTHLGTSGGPDGVDDYLNGGLLVLAPDRAVFDDMTGRIATLTDLAAYPFAEQDFLNEYYSGRWQPLPYVYNALKTLQYQHPDVWRTPAVKNIHYIIDKPWEKTPDPEDPYFTVDELWRGIAATVGTQGSRP